MLRIVGHVPRDRYLHSTLQLIRGTMQLIFSNANFGDASTVPNGLTPLCNTEHFSDNKRIDIY